MSYPCDPPPYSDKNHLIPVQPEDYSQLGPSAVGYLQPRGYPQPGGDPGASVQPAACAGGYLVPGGYAPSVGYPQPMGSERPRPGLPMRSGDTALPTGNSYIVTSFGDDVVRTIDWDDKEPGRCPRVTPLCPSVPCGWAGLVPPGDPSVPVCALWVYTIISVQLLVTVGIIAVFTFVSPVRIFVQGNVAVYYSS
nr:protein lifeguard 3-like [Chrysemys picta bellii]